MRLKKIVLGLSAVAAAAGLAACSGGSTAGNSTPGLAVNSGSSSASQSSPASPAVPSSTRAPSTVPTSTIPPATTKAPVPTTQPPAATKAPVAATEAAATGTPCAATAVACVDLSAHEAWLLHDGQVVYGPVHAEGGRTGWGTAVGTFHVTMKAAHFYSTEFHAPMPYSVFFYRGDAFHEGSATTPSHGCVHLSLSAAQTFYQDLSVGDEVQVVS